MAGDAPADPVAAAETAARLRRRRSIRSEIRDQNGNRSYSPSEIEEMCREAKIGVEETGGYFPGQDKPPDTGIV